MTKNNKFNDIQSKINNELEQGFSNTYQININLSNANPALKNKIQQTKAIRSLCKVTGSTYFIRNKREENNTLSCDITIKNFPGITTAYETMNNLLKDLNKFCKQNKIKVSVDQYND
jgi:hypothetical protein